MVLPMDIKEVFQRTALDVQKSTRSRQTPYLFANCDGPAYLVDNHMGNYAAAQNFLQRRRPCGYYPASDKRRHAIPNHQPRIKTPQYRRNTQFGMPKNYHSSNKMMLPSRGRMTVPPTFPLVASHKRHHALKDGRYQRTNLMSSFNAFGIY
ncbi:unnamed protein product [Rotaria socialis]